ncbi:hypothetical protein [Streptomyces sp. NPDC018045]|uniref:hypothetical protein n=1 Tax=Streptomyces sp. NPDC018045 TaxID=3365037 RepID=UPI0037B97256
MTVEVPGWLHIGARVVDTSLNREGVVHGMGEPYVQEETPSCVWLLPPHGGYEWRAKIADVCPAEGAPETCGSD